MFIIFLRSDNRGSYKKEETTCASEEFVEVESKDSDMDDSWEEAAKSIRKKDTGLFNPTLKDNLRRQDILSSLRESDCDEIKEVATIEKLVKLFIRQHLLKLPKHH